MSSMVQSGCGHPNYQIVQYQNGKDSQDEIMTTRDLKKLYHHLNDAFKGGENPNDYIRYVRIEDLREDVFSKATWITARSTHGRFLGGLSYSSDVPGWLQNEAQKNQVSIAPQNSAYFGTLWVSKQHRGLNLGKVLVEKAEELAKTEGKERMYILVLNNSNRLFRYYEKKGFVVQEPLKALYLEYSLMVKEL